MTILIDNVETVVTVAATDAHIAGLQPGSFTINREGALDSDLVVRLTWGGTAAHDLHYTVSIDGVVLSSRPATVTLAAGQASLVITITPKPEPQTSTTRTVIFEIAYDAAYRVGEPGTATVRIHPDTTLPRLSINSLVVQQHPNRQEWATLTITLSAPAPTSVTFTVRTYDGTATAHTHYRPLTEIITLSAGQTSTTVRVRILPGTNPDPLYFTVELSDPVNAVIGDGVGVVWLVPWGSQSGNLTGTGTSGTSSLTLTDEPTDGFLDGATTDGSIASEDVAGDPTEDSPTQKPAGAEPVDDASTEQSDNSAASDDPAPGGSSESPFSADADEPSPGDQPHDDGPADDAPADDASADDAPTEEPAEKPAEEPAEPAPDAPPADEPTRPGKGKGKA